MQNRGCRVERISPNPNCRRRLSRSRACFVNNGYGLRPKTPDFGDLVARSSPGIDNARRNPGSFWNKDRAVPLPRA
ncbi:hypothetical protein [Mesorhizobium sp.]|uniref:hypothetical protein n=1 Tax=Mesorhizobium sp. TaxID=1871066 RepID=UPI0025BEC5FD|nr:hypothetical protein [Mesorhizobium sp.]